MVSLYFITPLQQPLAQGFHKVAHAFIKTNSNHSHTKSHTAQHNHHDNHIETHTHELVTFFNSLFSKDSTKEQQKTKTIDLDKHILQLTVFKPKYHKPKNNQQFYWLTSKYSISISITSPPPKGDAS